MLRDKLNDKYEFVHMDPLIEQNVIYKEAKKMRTIDKPKGSGGEEQFKQRKKTILD